MARPSTLTVRGSLCARKRVAIEGALAITPGRAGGRKFHFPAISPGGGGSVCARKRVAKADSTQTCLAGRQGDRGVKDTASRAGLLS